MFFFVCWLIIGLRQMQEPITPMSYVSWQVVGNEKLCRGADGAVAQVSLSERWIGMSSCEFVIWQKCSRVNLPFSYVPVSFSYVFVGWFPAADGASLEIHTSVLTFSSTSPTPCFTLRLITPVGVEKALRVRRIRPLPVATPSPISLTQWRWMDRWVDGLRTLVKCTRNRRGRVSCATLKIVSAFVEISWNISLATGAANCASTSSWNNWRILPTIFKKTNS